MKPRSVFVFCFAALSVFCSGADLDVSMIKVSDDVDWTLAGTSVAGSIEKYDERQLHITGGSGLTIDSLRIILDNTGSFDDSIGMDVDADGTIDFLSTENDALATPAIGGVYVPWVDASPYTLDATITLEGTVLTSYWDGVEIQLTEGFNNASTFTLEDLGFGSDGVIPSDDFTTGSIRVGNLNVVGPSGHDIDFGFDAVVLRDQYGNEYIFDPDGDGLPVSVPEPTSAILVALTGLTVFGRRRQRR